MMRGKHIEWALLLIWVGPMELPLRIHRVSADGHWSTDGERLKCYTTQVPMIPRGAFDTFRAPCLL